MNEIQLDTQGREGVAVVGESQALSPKKRISKIKIETYHFFCSDLKVGGCCDVDFGVDEIKRREF